MRTHRALATVTAVALTTATLTGCTATSPEPTTPTVEAAESTPEPTEEPVVEESPEPTAPTLPEYTLADGTTVTINPNEALPEAVVNDMIAVTGAGSTVAATVDESVAKGAAVAEVIQRTEALGKVPFTVLETPTYDVNGNLARTQFIATPPENDPLYAPRDSTFSDAATARQVARDRIATSPDPTRYVLLDLTS